VFLKEPRSLGWDADRAPQLKASVGSLNLTDGRASWTSAHFDEGELTMKTNHASWTLRLVVVAVLAVLNGPARAQSPRAVAPTSVMNEELMARLIKYTRADPDTGALPARICKVLDLCDGTSDMPIKFSRHESANGTHYFGVPPHPDSKAILIGLKRDTILEIYLTDKTGKLRAAAISENGIARLITNEKAAEKFEAELALFAKEAADLPPTGAAAPGKN
jgi:hypothetical protein